MSESNYTTMLKTILQEEFDQMFKPWASWVKIQYDEDGTPINVPVENPVLVPPTKRMGMTVAKWSERDGWETETTSEWVSMYRPSHYMVLPPEPEAA